MTGLLVDAATNKIIWPPVRWSGLMGAPYGDVLE